MIVLLKTTVRTLLVRRWRGHRDEHRSGIAARGLQQDGE